MARIFIPGETTYDIIFRNGEPVSGNVGGSQLNTTVSLGRLGLEVHFISAISLDPIGKLSLSFLEENNIRTGAVKRYEGLSRLALAFLDENNNANYSFYPSDFKEGYSFPVPGSEDVILFGSSFALNPVHHTSLREFLKKGRETGSVIVYDPNIRKSYNALSQSERELIYDNMRLSHILKASDEDFMNLLGTSNPEEIWRFVSSLGVQLLFITAGAKSVSVCSSEFSRNYNVPKIETVSTIGAGDNFNAGIIFSLVQHSLLNRIPDLTEQDADLIVSIATGFSQAVCMSEENYLDSRYCRRILSNYK